MSGQARGGRFACPICGNWFFVPSLSNYLWKEQKIDPEDHKKKKMVYLCSYTCKRQLEKENSKIRKEYSKVGRA